MTADNKDPLGIGHWPKWKQIAFFCVAMVISLAAFEWIKQAYMDSPEARAIKAKMEPLAEQLEKAQKLGDKPTVMALIKPTTSILDDYNGLDAARKEQINRLPLRYCVLAAVHLSAGPIEVLETGYWASKSKYDAALEECQ